VTGIADVAARAGGAGAALATAAATAVPTVYFVGTVTAATRPSNEGNQQQTGPKRRTSQHHNLPKLFNGVSAARNDHL
jgi:hypothetical protein